MYFCELATPRKHSLFVFQEQNTSRTGSGSVANPCMQLQHFGRTAKKHEKCKLLHPKQGVAIARTLYNEAELIVLDEPTNNLSLNETQKVFDFMELRTFEHCQQNLLEKEPHKIIGIGSMAKTATPGER